MTILDTIVEEKKRELARLPQRSVSSQDIRDALQARDDTRDFLQALRHPKADSIALIASRAPETSDSTAACSSAVMRRSVVPATVTCAM